MIDCIKCNTTREPIETINFKGDLGVEIKKSVCNECFLEWEDDMQMKVMNEYLRGTEKSKLVYNYSALTTNVILNYVKYKTGDDWEKLLNKVYSEHVGVKNSVRQRNGYK